MQQSRFTTENIIEMEVLADIFADRSHAANSIAQRMRQTAEAMQQEAQRLHHLADQIVAATIDAAIADYDSAPGSVDSSGIRLFK